MPLVFGFDVPPSFTPSLGRHLQDQETLEAWRAFKHGLDHWRQDMTIWQIGFDTVIEDIGPHSSNDPEHCFACTVNDESDHDEQIIMIKTLMASAREEFGENRVRFWYQLCDGDRKQFFEHAAEISMGMRMEKMVKDERMALLREMEEKIAEHRRLEEEKRAKWLKLIVVLVFLIGLFSRKW